VIGHRGTRHRWTNEGGASNHTGGNNEDQGRQSQLQKQRYERRGLQNKTLNKTQKLWIMTPRSYTKLNNKKYNKSNRPTNAEQTISH